MNAIHTSVLAAVAAEHADGFMADTISVARRTGIERKRVVWLLTLLWQRGLLGKNWGGYWLAGRGGT